MTVGESLSESVELKHALLARYEEMRRVGALSAKISGNDISDTVQKFIPEGSNFTAAENLLRAAGFKVDPRPGPDAPMVGLRRIYDVIARSSSILPGPRFLGGISVIVSLSPVSPTDYSRVTRVRAGIFISTL